ncbi:gluconate 2-dehydrogenase subunit 3 family protein [Kushneria indalinina]|uniref:Gluconate 2-dehydrogenase gamma chain n=1 Tax=Kushneria indalinina DSM 14324 TaxID=1122140 RepID=A0A3D9E0Q4_9GAMM|nr:gluconate 2-dehydrogenase subunit 3 family protein [Kushneria indalinina]REC96623.1 gluconate 2-dehydrogenase gamma chain [Kushneria indalinina DSM 14324]
MSSRIHNRQRRDFLRGSLTMIPAITLGSGVSLTARAAEQAPALSDYSPLFFTSDEWAFVLAACDRLIPGEGEGPGALDTNVPVFIDRQMDAPYGHAERWYMEGPFVAGSSDLGFQYPYTPREVYQRGIALTQRWCQQHHDARFESLEADTRDQVLSALEQGEVDFAALDEEWLTSDDFFSWLLQHTKEGYLSDPIHGGNKNMAAWKMVGFPGARASFRDWVDQHDVEYPLGPVSLSGERG